MTWPEAAATITFIITAGSCVAWWLYLSHRYEDGGEDE